MKKIFYFALAIGLWSCDQAAEDKAAPIPKAERPKEVDTSATGDIESIDNKGVQVDSLDGHLTFLQQYYSEGIIDLMREYREKWNAVETADDMEAFFDFSDDAARKFSESTPNEGGEDFMMIQHNDTVQWTPIVLPGLSFSCVAECTMPMFMHDFAWFKKQAKRTDGTKDDRFFGTMHQALGDVDHLGSPWGSWYMQTWDLGGSSMLGRGEHTDLLKQIESYTESGAFRKELEGMREQLMNDMLDWNSYWLPADSVVMEMETIMQEVKLSKEEIEQIKQRIEEVKAHEENDIEVGCKSGDCSYG